MFRRAAATRARVARVGVDGRSAARLASSLPGPPPRRLALFRDAERRRRVPGAESASDMRPDAAVDPASALERIRGEVTAIRGALPPGVESLSLIHI